MRLKLFLAIPLLLACNLLTSQSTPISFQTPVPNEFVLPIDQSTPQSFNPPLGDSLTDAKLELVNAALLFDHVTTLADIPSRHVNSPGIQTAANLIAQRFADIGGRWQVAFQEFPYSFNGIHTTQRNVLATLPGQVDQIVLVGAHYDSRTRDIRDATAFAPGANDNGTGIAILLEIARLLANENPHATIVLAAFSAEEIDAGGATAYLADAQASRLSFRSVLILDTLGNPTIEQGASELRVFADPDPNHPGRQLALWLPSVAQRYVPEMQILVQPTLDRPGFYSDHVPFSAAGYPAVRLIESLENRDVNHTGNDVPNRLDAQYLLRAARIALAATILLAFEVSEVP